jgi:iron complex outermembrane receptor protein
MLKGSKMAFNYNKLSAAVLAVIGSVALSSGAQAQGTQIEEVLVTAQKREQTLQDIPVAVSAFSGDFMKKANITDVRGLVDFTPGFSGRTEDSFTDALAMRGVVTNDYGIGGDPSVAVFQDGVWAGRTGGVQMSFYDISRAEVVKGPQGTLFGRNAIAGAVEIITNKPTGEFEASVDFTLAQYNHLEGTATINQPLTDNLYFRASVYGLKNDGYLENLQGGDDLGFHDNKSARLAMRYAGDVIDATLMYQTESRDQDPSVYWDPESGLPTDQVNIDLKGGEGFDTADIDLITLHADFTLSEALTLSSITAYKTYDFDYLEDYDAGPELVNNYRQKNDVEYTSQEFRLTFADDGPLSGFAGISAYQEEIDGFFEYIYDEDALCRALAITDAGDFDPALGPVTDCSSPAFADYWEEQIDPADQVMGKAEQSYVDVESSGYAVYGDLTYSLSDRLDVTAGARYTLDKKKLSNQVLDSGGALYNNFNYEFMTLGALSNEDEWSEFTPRVAMNYDFSDDVALYVNAAKGYKSGGFATFGFDISDNTQNPYVLRPEEAAPKQFDPETVMSYEVGMKTRLLDNSMQFNVALFTYAYEDLQLAYFDEGSTQVANVGEATGTGLEMDLRYLPSENWDIFLSGAYLSTEITDDEAMVELGACGGCEGNTLPFAPELSASAIVTYLQPLSDGDMFFSTEVIYQSEMFGGPDNFESVAVQPWTEVAFRLGYDSNSDWNVALFVENVTDETYFERGWENADENNEYGYGLPNTFVWPSKPRTVGVSFGMSFD